MQMYRVIVRSVHHPTEGTMGGNAQFLMIATGKLTMDRAALKHGQVFVLQTAGSKKQTAPKARLSGLEICG